MHGGRPFRSGDPTSLDAQRRGGLASAESRRRARLGTVEAVLERLQAESFHAFFRQRLGFQDGSWAAAHLVAKLLDGVWEEALMPEEHALYGQLSGGRKTLPSKLLTLWLLLGRGAGKSTIAGAFACHVATRRYDPDQRPEILLLAGDQVQAGVLFGIVLDSFERDPDLKRLVVRQRLDSLHLATGVVIRVRTGHWRRVRGPTLALVVGDEASFWWSDESASNPDVEVLRSVRPGLLKLRGGPGRLLVTTTPYMQAGATWQAWEQFYGKEHPTTLVLHAPTRVFNPTMSADAIAAEVADDPLAESEYSAEFRQDLAAFLSPEAIQAVVEPGVFERPPVPGVAYLAFVDMSGGGKDSLALAIAHPSDDGEVAIVDVVRDRPPPLDIEGAIAEWAPLLRSYGIAAAVGDRYARQLTVEAWARQGISYEFSALSASEIYLEALPAFNTGRVALVDDATLRLQLSRLVRQARRGGKDLVTHPAGAHDDLANVVCGAVTLVLGLGHGGASEPLIPQAWLTNGEETEAS